MENPRNDLGPRPRDGEPGDPRRHAPAVGGVPPGWFALRVLWVGVQLYLVFCLGQQGNLFFYQGF